MGAQGEPQPPFFFAKPAHALVANPVRIPMPPQTCELHHEVELLLVLGRGGHNLTVDAAAQCIIAAGVAVDLTRRDVQALAKQQGRPWALAKGFDFSAPCGEVALVDEPLPADAELALWVDGVQMQRGRLAQMIAPQAAVIAALSQQVRLAPGDVILTGTPAGVGPLSPGQTVRARIDGLPELTFEIGEPDTMATTEQHVTAEDVLAFWFGEPGTPVESQFQIWFKKDPELDALIRTRFEGALQRATRGELDSWAETPRGRLALIILLDQFSRNMYRDTPAAFAQDEQARALALAGVELGHDAALAPIEAAFVYMPFEHGESMAWQERAVASLTALTERTDLAVIKSFVTYAHKHHEVIAEFGRYPHRNAILQRDNTEAEEAYLAQPGAGF